MKKTLLNLFAILILLVGVFFLSKPYRNSKNISNEFPKKINDKKPIDDHPVAQLKKTEDQLPKPNKGFTSQTINDLKKFLLNKEIEKITISSISKIKKNENNQNVNNLDNKKNSDLQIGNDKSIISINNLENKQIDNSLSDNVYASDVKENQPYLLSKQNSMKIDEIYILANRWTCQKIIKNTLNLKKDDNLNLKLIKKNINFLNLNPFRWVFFDYYEKNNKYDLEFFVQERFPLRIYTGFDNTGLKKLDENRFYVGFDWNRAFFINSILSYQFLTDYNFEKFLSHTIDWTFYLPWKNYFKIFGNHSNINVDLGIPVIYRNEGYFDQASIRYSFILPTTSHLNNEIIAGFDFKRTNTNLFFSRFRATNDLGVNLSQFLLSYSLNSFFSHYQNKVALELYSSFGELLPDEQDYRYNTLRAFANNKYFYAKFYFYNLFHLPKEFLLSLIMNAQVSNENLLPSETFGIGGYNSVRGYFEREINTDSGFTISAEIRSLPISFIPKKRDSFRVVAFLDYGLGTLHRPLYFEEKTKYLLGIGPGLRYTIDPYLAARLDLGFGIKHSMIINHQNPLAHFSVNISY